MNATGMEERGPRGDRGVGAVVVARGFDRGAATIARDGWLRFDPARDLRPRPWAEDPPASQRYDLQDIRSARYRWWYTLTGLVLALGAPAGALLLRIAVGTRPAPLEISAHAFFYLYMLLGTSAVFGAAGFVAGYRADLLVTQRDRFIELAERDGLTGLLNSRAFSDRYRRSVEKAMRYGGPLSLLIIDLDQLKKINDDEGHRFGNRALQHVSDAIVRVARSDDISARWGGDEFVILMPGAPIAAAERVAEALLQAIANDPVNTSRSERIVSVTVGVASGEGAATEGLFDRADRALYLGKREGGNRYRLAPGPA